MNVKVFHFIYSWKKYNKNNKSSFQCRYCQVFFNFDPVVKQERPMNPLIHFTTKTNGYQNTVTFLGFSFSKMAFRKTIWLEIFKEGKVGQLLSSSATTFICTVAMTSETWRDVVAMTAALVRRKTAKTAYIMAIKARRLTVYEEINGTEQNIRYEKIVPLPVASPQYSDILLPHSIL